MLGGYFHVLGSELWCVNWTSVHLGVNLLSQSKRSSLTCTYKCGSACAGECTNESNNPYFGDIVSRRGVLKAFGAGTVTLGGSVR